MVIEYEILITVLFGTWVQLAQEQSGKTQIWIFSRRFIYHLLRARDFRFYFSFIYPLCANLCEN